MPWARSWNSSAGTRRRERVGEAAMPCMKELAETVAGRMSRAGGSILVLDYDGTLAPFRVDPSTAFPYPGVTETLSKIREAGGKIALVTGREPEEVAALMPLDPPVEIWGCHGAVRLAEDGTREAPALDGETRARLEEAGSLAETLAPGRVERKAASVAVHWRGAGAGGKSRVGRLVSGAWEGLKGERFSIEPFDGGLELRARGFDKGVAMHRILSRCGKGDFAAFLGDDLTDEDGFDAVGRFGGIGILVRPELRETKACFWIVPPGELRAFLDLWLKEVTKGGNRPCPR